MKKQIPQSYIIKFKCAKKVRLIIEGFIRKCERRLWLDKNCCIVTTDIMLQTFPEWDDKLSHYKKAMLFVIPCDYSVYFHLGSKDSIKWADNNIPERMVIRF